MQVSKEELKSIFEGGEFAEEDKAIIVDFCNTFQKVFSNVIDADELMKRIRRLKKMEYKHQGEKCAATYSQNGTLTINDDIHGNKRKAVIYHELMHLVSMHLPRKNPEFGLAQGFKTGSVEMNEIMTEYFATRLLLQEGIEDLKGKYYITNEGGIQEYVEYEGTGYIKVAKLGEMYHEIFGQEIVDGYFNNAIKFQNMFNEKYQVLGDEEFTPMENAVDTEGNIYKNYANALRIFMINEDVKLKAGNLSIYEYLQESKRIKDCLPVRRDVNLERCEITGIPAGIEKYLLKLDERFVAQFIRPDVVGKPQDANTLRKKKDFFIGLNAIRDNIEQLSPEDLDNIEIGSEYNQDSKTMNISVNGKNIQVFTDRETYLGTNEIEKINTKDVAKKFARDKGVALRKEEAQMVFQQLENEQEHIQESPSLSE